MLKQIYRVIILIVIFVASIWYFSRDIKEVVFDIDNTTVMADASFPLVTIKTGNNTINLLHGYSTNLPANTLRESVTLLGTEQDFKVLIDQEKTDIKKLNYEVREFDGNALIETDSVSVFEDDKDVRIAKIKIKAELEQEKEYAVKITLITSESVKLYYYQRIKIYDSAHLDEELEFITNFHNALLDKEKAESIAKYLEPSDKADDSTLAYVNINSSFDLVSWGDLKPKILTEVVPTIREIYEDTTMVELSYVAEIEVSGKAEQYRIVEFYRVRYASDRMYLLNYERTMESIFDISLASLAKNELKLGVTSNLEVPFLAGDDGTKLAFIRNRELYFYNLEDNELTKVFSFWQQDTDYLRELYDQHDIRILSMDVEGNIDFMVYGYMNRGQYEGRVAVILYRFTRSDNRIEELINIPVEESFQTLKEKISDLAFVNEKETFYIHAYDTIYSYNLITNKLSEIAVGIEKEQVVVLKDINYVAWQEISDPKLSKSICIMNLETGKKETITAPEGYSIRLMDSIDSNIIYGYVKEDDIVTMLDGSLMAPLSTVEIASVDKKVLKSYSKKGYYTSDLEVKDNIVELHRVVKADSNGQDTYTAASDDFIMNQIEEQTELVGVTKRVTKEALTEYYLDLPEGFILNDYPKMITTVNTVIAQDPTVRLLENEESAEGYYPYITGGIEGSYKKASEAIAVANDRIGVVLNNKNQLVWERGVKKVKNTISEFEEMSWQASSSNTIENCIKLLLSYQKKEVSLKKLSVSGTSMYDVLAKYSTNTPVCLTGTSMDDVLYYVSRGRPVIAMTDIDSAVIIYGYDEFNIMILNPASGNVKKMGIKDSAALFEAAGNVFMSYLD
ncbi:MAG: hypothetical protein WBI07_20660 [Mobilitalea sp.]